MRCASAICVKFRVKVSITTSKITRTAAAAAAALAVAIAAALLHLPATHTHTHRHPHLPHMYGPLSTFVKLSAFSFHFVFFPFHSMIPCKMDQVKLLYILEAIPIYVIYLLPDPYLTLSLSILSSCFMQRNLQLSINLYKSHSLRWLIHTYLFSPFPLLFIYPLMNQSFIICIVNIFCIINSYTFIFDLGLHLTLDSLSMKALVAFIFMQGIWQSFTLLCGLFSFRFDFAWLLL